MSFNIPKAPDTKKSHEESTIYTQTKTVGLAPVQPQHSAGKVSLTRPNFLTINGKSEIAPAKTSVPVGHKYTKSTSPVKLAPPAKVYATTGTNTDVEEKTVEKSPR